MKEPPFRCVTYIAIQSLVNEFGYHYDSNMQDWEYEVAKLGDIEKYFNKYNTTEDDDIRFLLMEMIISTSNENHDFNWVAEIWPRVQALLKEKFSLHEYTVYYWCDFGNENIEDCFYITASMRMLWNELNYHLNQ